MHDRSQTVCFFGIFDPNYSRTRVLKRGFEEHGYGVTLCRVDPREYGGLKTYWALCKAGMLVRGKQFNFVIVCFPGHTVVWLARLLFGKHIIFDAFLSLWDSNVADRRIYHTYDPRAFRDWLLDWSSCQLAEFVLLDTRAHIQFFVSKFHIPRSKCICVPVGSDPSLFYPQSTESHAACVVHFHGSFIPLQGVRYVVEAADLLRNEPIRMRILGDGQESSHIQQQIAALGLESSIERVGRVSLDDLHAYVASADIVLGIFGTSDKATRVVPNKVYEAMAMGKAIITADTPAIREFATEEPIVLVVPPGDSVALANAVRTLSRDSEMRRCLGIAAHAFFTAHLTPRHIVGNLLADLRVRSRQLL